eukprot:CAMPEP_0117484334 /NCGR_PEP_ID=MMETSP0784-20121206/14404_1 /TAXON_ID=39447 /ORGANISM="" /LENGTH=375 /DNA_ID=CAMNT_0005278903 /DNA_START=310 /DNA_END=1437 /DNA_ORIENTATION=+
MAISALSAPVAASGGGLDLSLVQVRAQAAVPAGEDKLATLASARGNELNDPDLDDVVDQLVAVNNTLDKITDVFAYVNETAMDMISVASEAIDAGVAALSTLESATAALKLLPDGDAYAEKAVDVIKSLNETLSEYRSKLDEIPALVQSTVDKAVPPQVALAQDLIQQLLTAAQLIQDLQKSEDSLVEVDAELNSTSAQIVPTKMTGAGREHVRGIRLLELLHARAIQTQGAAGATFEQAVAQKGSKSECAKAAGALDKANATLEKFEEQVAIVNGTANDLLGSVLDVAMAGLDAINSTLGLAMQAAEVIPSQYLDPVTSKLTDILDLGNRFTEIVQDAKPEIEARVVDAQGSLDSLPDLTASLADNLAAACAKE